MTFSSAYNSFSSFSTYAKRLKGMLWVGMWYALWAWIPMIVIGLLLLITSMFSAVQVIALMQGPLFLIALIAFVIFAYIKILGYIFVPFILSEYPDMGGRRALNLSKAMMAGNKWDLFELFISFTLWMLAVSLVGIALSFLGLINASLLSWVLMCVYVMPYVLTSLAGAYDRIKLDCIDEGRFDGVEGLEPVWSEMGGSQA